MKILVCGYDGYIGYPLTLHLLRKGHEIFCVDNFSRRRRVDELGSDSLTPITSAAGRRINLRHIGVTDVVDISLGVDSPGHIASIIRHFKPDAIVHLAEQPSAPWSMKDASHAAITQRENVVGTLDLLWAMKEECPNAHLVKLGSLGEYGTPNCDIPEGKIPNQPCLHTKEHPVCPMSGLPFPRSPGSFYHLSKVHDTHNIIFVCKTWRLSCTDIMQGIVFGLQHERDEEPTRFDYDECFGTVINRFCVQALIEHPLTVYGSGAQKRGFLPLKESIRCLTLALENPPAKGDYRTFNQFGSIHHIYNLAYIVQESAHVIGLDVGIEYLKNPRAEAYDHYYNPTHQKLFDLGYRPTTDITSEITSLLRRLLPYKDRIKREVILPKIEWK